MAQAKPPLVIEEILPCPFCGKPAVKPYEYIDGINTRCSNSECELADKNLRLNTWQKRHNTDLRQAYIQFEESIRRERIAADYQREMTTMLFSKIAHELGGGMFMDGVPLSPRHAKSINEIIALAKEYLNA